ncbi:uncharacterized protein MONOS_18598 [Monocercomonoides exilis]|uniref:uncharacterized protein n=1 Tax=Monocercomonoides exilis TaxID=2049356 RepID=UPI003559EEAB|nr:hypothetical protein MONOS_18598 [Monocercomonoides exilis]
MSNKQSHRKCDCTLKNNQPKGRGGAMYLSMPSLLPLTQLPPLTFSSVKFRGNSAFEGHNIFIVMKNFERISSYWIEAFYEIEFPAEENGRSLFGCTSEDCEAGLNLYSIWIRKEKIAYVNGDPQRGKDWMMCSSEEQPCSTLLEAKSHFVSDNCDMKSIIIQNYISQNSHIDLGGYCIQKAENLSLSEFILSLNERTEEDCCISNINNPLCISGMSIMFSSNAPCNSVFHSENSIFSLYNGRFSERKDSSFSVDHFSSSQPFKNTGPKAKLTSELSYPSVSSFLIVVNGKCEITTFEIDKVNFQCSLIRCLFSEKQNSIDQVIFIGANFSNVHLNNGSILMIEPQNDITKNGEQDIGESDSFVRKIIMSRCTFLSVVSDSNFSAVFYPISLNSNDKYSFETSSNNSDCLMPFQKEKAFLPISLCITDCTFGLCYSRMAKKGGLFFVPIYRSSHLFFSNCRFCHCLEYESNSVFKQFNEKYQNKSSNELGCNTDSFARYINILFEQESQGRIFEKNCGLSSFMNIEHSNDLINYSTKSSFGVICYALCVEEAPNVQLDSIITIDHPSHAHGLFFIHAPSITSIANHSSFRFFKTADTILVHTLCATEKDDDLFVDILSSYWALDFTTKVFVSSDGTYDRKCGIQQTTACKLFRDAMDHLKVDKEVQVVVVNEVEILEQTSLQNAVVCSLNKRATLLINYNQKTENVKDTAVILSVGSLSIESIDVACSLQLMPDNIFSGAFLCVGGSLTLTNVTFRLSSKLEDAYRSESQQDQSLPSVLICSFCTSIHIIESQFVSIIRNGTGPSVLQHESTTNFDADLSISANNTMFYQCSSFECEGAVAHIEGKSSIIFEGCNFIGLLDQPKENSVLSTFKQSAINKTHENDCNITQFNQKPNEQSGMCEWESSMVYVFGSNSLDVINSNFSNSSLGALTVINTDSVEINDCCFFDNSPHFAAFPSVRRNAHIRGAKSCLLKNLKFPKDLIESGASSYGDNNDRIHSFLEEQLSPERQKFAPMWFKLEDTILEGNYPENHPFFFVPQLHRAVLQISKKGKHLKFYGDLLLPCQTQFLISIQKKASSSNFPSDVLFRSSFFTMHNNTRHTQNLIHPSTSPLVQSDRSEVTWTEVSATVLNESYATSDTDIIPFSSTTHELLVKMLVMETSNFSLETPTIVAQILYDDSDTSKDDNKSKVILIVCVCIGVVFTLGGGIIIVVGIVLRKRKIKKMKLSQSVIADYRPINADDFYFSGSANFPNRMLLSPLHRYYCYSLDSDSSTTNKHVMNRSSHKNRQTKLPTLPQDCQQPNMEED